MKTALNEIFNKVFKNFYVYSNYEEDKKFLLRRRSMKLKFVRKLSKSMENRAAIITVPRAVAQSWERYESVDLVFDGNCLIIKPRDIGSDNA